MKCRKCGLDLLGQDVCQGCDTPSGIENYDDKPKQLTHNKIYNICHEHRINRHGNEAELFHTRLGMITGSTIECKLNGGMCSSSNCPIKNFVNEKIKEINGE
jgi:hypothetical protein